MNKYFAKLQYRYVKEGMTVTEAYIFAFILGWNNISGKPVNYTNAKIGEELGLEPRTVKNALAGLRDKKYVLQKGRHPRAIWALEFDDIE